MLVVGEALKFPDGHLDQSCLGAALLVAGPFLDETFGESGALVKIEFRICEKLLVAGDEELRLLCLNVYLLQGRGTPRTVGPWTRPRVAMCGGHS